MNRRQLFKKIAGIAGAVLAAPVMGKEVIEKTSGTTGIAKFSISGELKIAGSTYNPGVKGPATIGQIVYMPNGTWKMWDGDYWVFGNYDLLDGQHGAFHLLTPKI